MEKVRFGRFSLSRELLVNTPIDEAKMIFDGMIPWKVDMQFDTDRIEYLAVGNMFDEIDRHSPAPEYECKIYVCNSGIEKVDFVRMENGKTSS